MKRLLAVVLLVCPIHLFGQTSANTVTGRVAPSDGYVSEQPIGLELQLGDQVVTRTRTDSLGNFEFSGVRPGRYVIRVTEPGFAETENPIDTGNSSSGILIQLFKAAGSSDPARHRAHVVQLEQLSVPEKALDEYGKAEDEYRNGRIKNAIDRLKKAVEIAPDYYDAHWLLGLRYLEITPPGPAESHFLRAAELNPRAAEPWFMLGLQYIQNRDPEAAVRVLQRAVDLNPAFARAAFYLGSALYQTNEFARAEPLLKRAWTLNPGLHGAGVLLAHVYARRGKLQEALEQLDDYFAKVPAELQDKSAVPLRDTIKQHLAREATIVPASPNATAY